MNEQFWWYLSRASGTVAWFLAMASILWGTALATRVMGKRPPAPWLLDLHRHLAGLMVVFVGIHLAALAADSYVHFGWADLFVPWASAWKSSAVAWGVIAWWMLVAVEVSSLLMRRLPRRWWRRIHLGSYAVAVLSTVHLFAAGTDASSRWLRGSAVAFVLVLVFFLLYRELDPRRKRTARPSAPAGAQMTAVGGRPTTE
jgi:sulfoxide reductase heme-binding subunit YedZ